MMHIFSYLYDKIIGWSRHRHAPYYLAGLSFAESSFFPVPPDVMLASMTLAKPDKAWYYALLTTISSVLGGLVGYIIGALFFELAAGYISYLGYETAYQTVQQWFVTWGFWIVFLAGFSPIPYKLFTIAAGAMHMALLPFVVASLIARGARFFLVAGLLYLGGERFENQLRRYVNCIGWLMVALAAIGMLIYQLRS
jgi:membrane protein YqaA with SNARE-associated domain